MVQDLDTPLRIQHKTVGVHGKQSGSDNVANDRAKIWTILSPPKCFIQGDYAHALKS